MLRVVLAVLLATALLGVSTTALADARQERAATLAGGEAAAVTGAVRNLAGTEPATDRASDAARRVLRIDVPTASPTTARVEYLSLGSVPGRSVDGDDASRDVVAYKLPGGAPQVRWLPVDLRVPGPGGPRPDSVGLVLERPTRVALSLVRRAGRSVVLARRW